MVECEGLGLLNEHVSPDENLTYESADGELLSDDEYETSEELDSDNETVRGEEQDDELERMKKTIWIRGKADFYVGRKWASQL